MPTGSKASVGVLTVKSSTNWNQGGDVQHWETQFAGVTVKLHGIFSHRSISPQITPKLENSNLCTLMMAVGSRLCCPCDFHDCLLQWGRGGMNIPQVRCTSPSTKGLNQPVWETNFSCRCSGTNTEAMAAETRGVYASGSHEVFKCVR